MEVIILCKEQECTHSLYSTHSYDQSIAVNAKKKE